MTIIATSRCRNARLFRQCSTGHRSAHSDTKITPQFDQSSSCNTVAFDHGEPIMRRTGVNPFPQSRRRHSHAPRAAPKSRMVKKLKRPRIR
jgi:hypothetical protein